MQLNKKKTLFYRRIYSSRTLIDCTGSDGSLFSVIMTCPMIKFTFSYYIIFLVKELDKRFLNWRNDSVLLFDNCTAHTAKLRPHSIKWQTTCLLYRPCLKQHCASWVAIWNTKELKGGYYWSAFNEVSQTIHWKYKTKVLEAC